MSRWQHLDDMPEVQGCANAARSRSAPAVVGLVVLVVMAVLVLLPATSASARATSDPALAARWAGTWLAELIPPDGALRGADGGVDLGDTATAALALAASGTGRAARDGAAAVVTSEVETYTAGTGGDLAGPLARVVLLADATGADPRAFGDEGVDLIARLRGTLDGPEEADPGLLAGAGTPRTGEHALAVLALRSADEAVPDAALRWLEDQQCASGGFTAYRPPAQRTDDPEDTCPTATSAGATDYTPDAHSTALAVQALAAAGALARTPYSALGYLDGVQESDGGFGFLPGSGTDAASTGLVVQALLAAGQSPEGERFTVDGRTPLDVLLDLQLGCDAEAADRGGVALTSRSAAQAEADLWATAQAIPALAGTSPPFGPRRVDDETPRPPCALEVSRLAGPDRVATAAMVAEDAWPDGAPTVLLANGYRYADALTGAPLATALDAPILLTGGEELAARAREALVTLGARTVIVLGGTAAVSAATADAVAVLPGVTRVDRIAGTDRFDTAVRIGQRIGGDAVYVTEGANADPARGWPDSLAAASLAAAQGRAIVLVTRDALPSTARDFLATKDAATIVGGTAAVSTEVEEAMDRVVGVVDRVAGNTRYTTALAVAREAQVGGADGRRTYLATGSAFADALAAGPAVARTGGVLMLVDGQRYAGAPATAAYLRETAVDQLVALGGEQAITAATLARATEDARAGRQEAP